MINYKILTDTGCDLPFGILKEHAVDVIGMVVNFNGEEYIEDNWKNISIEDYYNALRTGAQPTTSQITFRVLRFFPKSYLEKGEEHSLYWIRLNFKRNF